MRTTKRVCGVTTIVLVLAVSLSAAHKPKTQPAIESTVPSLQLAGGRSLIYERSFSSEREVKLKRASGPASSILSPEPLTITSWSGRIAW